MRGTLGSRVFDNTFMGFVYPWLMDFGLRVESRGHASMEIFNPHLAGSIDWFHIIYRVSENPILPLQPDRPPVVNDCTRSIVQIL